MFIHIDEVTFSPRGVLKKRIILEEHHRLSIVFRNKNNNQNCQILKIMAGQITIRLCSVWNSPKLVCFLDDDFLSLRYCCRRVPTTTAATASISSSHLRKKNKKQNKNIANFARQQSTAHTLSKKPSCVKLLHFPSTLVHILGTRLQCSENVILCSTGKGVKSVSEA